MKVIICGAGQVGWQIARHLSGENNDVTVVDNNPELVRRATDTLDVQGICGFASYPDVLERAGAKDADMIIAATHSGEVMIVLFFVLAISRLSFSAGQFGEKDKGLWRDPEFKMGISLVLLVTAALFLRHFWGAIDGRSETSAPEMFRAIWGAVFTVASFLTTTGFESRYWLGATDWSGLQTPGLALIGLALIGGGVATTAGGVKLLRIYALYRHSERELQRLVHPSSVGGGGREARRIRQQGAYISWVFFMLFALSIAAIMLLLSLTGVQFETAMVLAISALSTTGPLAEVAAENPISYAGIPDAAKVILAGAMVLGRLETLAIVALFNPEIWRN